MSTCPTAAMETMLHLYVREEVALSALRLNKAKNFKPGDLAGHLTILRDPFWEEKASVISDTMPMKYNFEQPVTVVIPDRGLWTSGGFNLNRRSTTWFTDASRINGSTGVGVYGPKCQVRKALGKNASIFKGEVYAIQLCAEINLKKCLKGATINIMSDSQAALKALRSFTCESHAVYDCLDTLKCLSKDNRVNLIGVPGHEGIGGNEKADELAKQGAALPFVGPEPFCGLPKSHLKMEIRNWEDKMKDSYWNSIPGQRQAKRFKTCSRRRAKNMLSLCKEELRLLTSLYTGHCCLNYHLNKMGKAENNACRLCNEAPETAEHILCSCEAASYRRLTHLSKAVLTPEEVVMESPKRVLSFVKSLNLF